PAPRDSMDRIRCASDRSPRPSAPVRTRRACRPKWHSLRCSSTCEATVWSGATGWSCSTPRVARWSRSGVIRRPRADPLFSHTRRRPGPGLPLVACGTRGQYTARMPPRARPAENSGIPAAIATAAAMLEQADAALGWLDLDGRLRWANASLLALVGRSSLPAAGVALDIAADDVSRWSTATARAISSATAIQLPFVQMGDGG